MDERFLEFWGNFLINAARGKKQNEEMSNWMLKNFSSLTDMSGQKMLSGLEEMGSLFRKFYGLEQISERGAEYESLMKKAVEDFGNSLNDYLGMMGMVSKAEHLELVRKYEKLKEKCSDQKETIRHLQMLLEAKDENQGDTIKNLRDIAKDQTELFQKMMIGFSQGFGKEKTSALEAENDKKSKGAKKEDDGPKTTAQTDG